MAQDNRPLSPHLQVYRPQITSVLSIVHRLTGIGLGAGAVALVVWLAAAAAGPRWFELASNMAASLPGQAVLLGFTWALFYHLCNGIRHLFWDVGLGFELTTARLSGWAVIITSMLLTGISWAIGLSKVAGA
jgi:succinate dehydrogenase / fumarate reductase, cytochrome b subunit